MKFPWANVSAIDSTAEVKPSLADVVVPDSAVERLNIMFALKGMDRQVLDGALKLFERLYLLDVLESAEARMEGEPKRIVDVDHAGIFATRGMRAALKDLDKDITLLQRQVINT